MATRNRIIDKLDSLEPAVKKAFLDAVAEIRSSITLTRLEAAIDAGDAAEAVRLAGLRSEAQWARITESTRNAFIEGGIFFAETAPASIPFAFNMTNPRAQEWLRNRSSDFVTEIVRDQRDAIRVALDAGTARGDNPRRTALDIAGRMNRRTGRRQGGIVGLTSQQARFVENARDELLRGDTAYLQRKRRDRRFDSLLIRAADEGKGLSQADADRVAARYSDRLLQLRGENISRTEVLGSFNGGNFESLQQAVEQGLVNPDNIQRVWRDASDGRVRDTHAAVDGTVVGMDEPFIVGGAPLMFPGDPNGPAAEIIGCRCVSRNVVDWIAEEQ